MIIRAIATEDSWAVSRHDRYWYLYGPDCHVPTRGQWETMKERIDNYYAVTSDEEIDRINQEADARLQHNYAEAQNLESSKAAPTPTAGYIYLIHGENTPWYKIGITSKPHVRFKQIEGKTPFRCEVLAVFKVDDIVRQESGWHELFDHLRAKGEWFELDEADVQLFVAQQGKIGGE